MQTYWGVATDAGGHREQNQDAVLASPPVFLVADGMGGHEAGGMASQEVVEAFQHLADELATAQRPARPEDVEQAVADARQAIAERLSGQDGEYVAGSTATGLVLTTQEGQDYWLVFNIGDSRIYRCTPEHIEQVSVDHSLVQEMVEAGTLSKAAAQAHPQRNIITRAIGTSAPSEVDYWMLRAGGRQRLVVCSDGLAGELSDEGIAAIVRGAATPHDAARELLTAALGDDGALDNVSVVVVEGMSEDVEDDADTTVPRPVEAQA